MSDIYRNDSENQALVKMKSLEEQLATYKDKYERLWNKYEPERKKARLRQQMHLSGLVTIVGGSAVAVGDALKSGGSVAYAMLVVGGILTALYAATLFIEAMVKSNI